MPRFLVGLLGDVLDPRILKRECALKGCQEQVTPEGLLCFRHWARVTGQAKAEYQRARWQAIRMAAGKEEDVV